MRITSYFLTVISAALLVSCSQMSDDEARRIILQYMKYPEPVFNITHAGPAGSPDIPKFIKGAEKLASDGYLTEEAVKSGGSQKDRIYRPTEKTRNYVTGVYVGESFALYDGALCNEVLKKIGSVEVDKERGTAVINYSTGYEPIEPIYSLLCINDYCAYFGDKLKKEEARMIRVKKYGKGWRISPA